MGEHMFCIVAFLLRASTANNAQSDHSKEISDLTKVNLTGSGHREDHPESKRDEVPKNS